MVDDQGDEKALKENGRVIDILRVEFQKNQMDTARGDVDADGRCVAWRERILISDILGNRQRFRWQWDYR